MRLRQVVAAAFFLIVVAAFWFALGRGIAVEVTSVIRGPAADLVYATGYVEPVVQAVIAPEVTARLVELLADERREVKVGDILARLDSAEQEATVREHEATVAHDRIDLERAQTLWNRRSGSKEDYDRALSLLQQDEAKLAAAQEKLSRYTLRAPVDGIVLRRDGEVGEVMQTGAAMFTLGQPGQLRATLEVDEEDIPEVKTGQKALLSADAWPGRVFEGEIAEITPEGDPVNKSYRVRVKLPPDFSMPVGMTVEANLVVEERQDVLLVPSTALVNGSVFVLEGGRVRLMPVDTGIVGTELAEIRSGLAEGDTVVRQPPDGLEDGARVHAK